MVAQIIGSEAVSIGGQIAKGLGEPMISFVVQPGRYKYPNRKRTAGGKVKMGKRVFVPSPHFPGGIRISFPAWFVATVGIAVIIYGVGGIQKILSGERLNKQEEASLNDIVALTVGGPVGLAVYKLLGIEE